MATHGSEAYPNDDTTQHDDGSAGAHHGSNDAHHPAASHGSHYNGGSAGAHYGSNHAPCDDTYCLEKCAQYYHCQFQHLQTTDCADAPDDCAKRCSGCPPPTAEHGSNYGSNYGSDHDTVGVVGSHGGQYSDSSMHDKLPGEHSAPTCLHNCFVHYAWKENLPRGEEPRCNLWSDYLFGNGCQEAHLKPTCYAEHDMHEVLLKCIDTGCDPRKCFGDTIEGLDQVNALLDAKPAGKCNKLKYVELVQKCKQGERACSDDVRGAGSNFGKLRATFCDTPVITASNGTATTAAAGGPGACPDFSACVSSALHASSCMHEAEPLAQGWMDFHKTEVAVCNYDPHKKQEPCRDLCQDEYRSKFNLPGNETVTNKCDYYRDFVFGQHRPAPCRATGFSGGPGMTKADNGNYGSNPAASYGSQHNGGSAGATHYNSNAVPESNPAASYGSQYNGGSAGATHYNSNAMPESNPAASYSSQYNGGSAGATHYNSNAVAESNPAASYSSQTRSNETYGG